MPTRIRTRDDLRADFSFWELSQTEPAYGVSFESQSTLTLHGFADVDTDPVASPARGRAEAARRRRLYLDKGGES